MDCCGVRSRPFRQILQFMLLLSIATQTVARKDPHEPSFHPPHNWHPTTRRFHFELEYKNVTVNCNTSKIVTVNGEFPGQTMKMYEGDRVVVTVKNNVKYNISIHWHGVDQRLSPWADGPAYITQCPILPGHSYTYNFTVVGQTGTLWWHAHVSWLRATVHGAFIVYPKPGNHYPFAASVPAIHEDVPILLGDFWNGNVEDIEYNLLQTGGLTGIPDAYLLNGYSGSSPRCPSAGVHSILDVHPGKTYLLRLINVALNVELYFAIANHTLTVVEVDGSYTKPYNTHTVILSPGQTTNVLVTADQPCNSYYMISTPYNPAPLQAYLHDQALAVLTYQNCSSKNVADDRGSRHGLRGNTKSADGDFSSSSPWFPTNLPLLDDTKFVADFAASIRGASDSSMPQTVDRNFFFAVALNLIPCDWNATDCQGLRGETQSASINNMSFVRPTSTAILPAYYYNISGIYTTDYPENPPMPYDYVNVPIFMYATPFRGTKVIVLEYGSNVQIVLQDTNTIGVESHPFHLHGYRFYVVGSGFGNYNAATAELNLVDPVQRNTVQVPSAGWVVIRFKADNPGVWFLHCHLEVHSTWGMDTVLIVKNGVGPDQTIPPPPSDYPQC